jgi:hypothetical protein
MIEIGQLELQPPFLQGLQCRIAPSGRHQSARRGRQIQLGEVTTTEMIGEVARR